MRLERHCVCGPVGETVHLERVNGDQLSAWVAGKSVRDSHVVVCRDERRHDQFAVLADGNGVVGCQLDDRD